MQITSYSSSCPVCGPNYGSSKQTTHLARLSLQHTATTAPEWKEPWIVEQPVFLFSRWAHQGPGKVGHNHTEDGSSASHGLILIKTQLSPWRGGFSITEPPELGKCKGNSQWNAALHALRLSVSGRPTGPGGPALSGGGHLSHAGYGHRDLRSS